jgi:hypothetical protein
MRTVPFLASAPAIGNVETLLVANSHAFSNAASTCHREFAGTLARLYGFTAAELLLQQILQTETCSFGMIAAANTSVLNLPLSGIAFKPPTRRYTVNCVDDGSVSPYSKSR